MPSRGRYASWQWTTHGNPGSGGRVYDGGGSDNITAAAVKVF